MQLRVGRRAGYVIPRPAQSPDRSATSGGAMYVRMTTLSFRVEKYDEGVRIFEDSVIPAAKAQPGFRGFYVLADRKAGRVVAMTFWADEASAKANEDNHYYQEQLVKFLPLYLSAPVREGFDLVIEAH